MARYIILGVLTQLLVKVPKSCDPGTRANLCHRLRHRYPRDHAITYSMATTELKREVAKPIQEEDPSCASDHSILLE